MQLIDWFKLRRIKSRYASNQAVEQFAGIAKEQNLPLDYGNDQRLADLLTADRAGNLKETAKLLGSLTTSPSCSGWNLRSDFRPTGQRSS